MAHELSKTKTTVHGFEPRHLPLDARAFDAGSTSTSAGGTFLPAPSRVDPDAAAQVMAHYADDVHPAPSNAGHRGIHKGHTVHHVERAGGTTHDWPIVQTGLGDRIDKIASKSQTLHQNLEKLHEGKWGFEYGRKGAGSFTDRKHTTIILDANKKNHSFSSLQSLAHESGHALYRPPPPILMDGHIGRQEYIDRNTDRCLQDEGEATIAGLQVREELLKAKAGDIGVSGAKAKEYLALFKKYHDAKDHDILRAEIAKVYGKGEHPSTAPAMTYEQFCAKPFADGWDRSHPVETQP